MNLGVLGDKSVGKTALIRTFLNSGRVNAVGEPLGYKYWYPPRNEFDDQNIRTSISIDGEETTLDITEANLRYGYSFAAVIVVCSVVDRRLWKNLMELKENVRRWNRRFDSDTTIILVGSKIDLRKDQNFWQVFSRNKQELPITTSMGKKLANKIQAAQYLECSCFDEKAVEKVFEEAVWASLRFPKSNTPRLRIVMDGKDFVGKTSIIRQFETGEPCDNPAITLGFVGTYKNIIVNQCKYPIEILEFNSLERGRGMRKVRPYRRILSRADVFIIVFSVINPASFNFITQRCIPDINDYSPFTPKVLVGSFADVRNESNNKGWKQTHITTEMGEELAQKINATAYFECSNKDGKGVNEIFEEAVRATFIHRCPWIFPRQTTLCFNISFFFDSKSSSLYEHFIVDERLNTIGERLNGHQKIEKMHLPCVLEYYQTYIEVDGEEYGLNISSFDINALQLLQWHKFPDCDTIAILFSKGNVAYCRSMETLAPKLNLLCPNVPIILMQNTLGQSCHSKASKTLVKNENQAITMTDMGEKFARRVNATKYLKCLSNDVNGIKKIFEEAVWASLRRVEEKFQKAKVSTTKKFRFFGL